jgi:hypothetical protein
MKKRKRDCAIFRAQSQKDYLTRSQFLQAECQMVPPDPHMPPVRFAGQPAAYEPVGAFFAII